MNKVRAFIHKTKLICWKCDKETPIVYAFRPPNNKFESEFKSEWLGNYEVDPDQDSAMGLALEAKYSWYRKGYSHTRGEEVHANFCISCDALQGNWFVSKHMRMQRADGIDLVFGDHIDYETNYDAIVEGSDEDKEIKASVKVEECPKFGFNHSINHCSCNPNYGREGYCQHCLTALMPFKITNDWKNRKYHKKCWKQQVDEGRYECSNCGNLCNDFLQEFCDCPEESL